MSQAQIDTLAALFDDAVQTRKEGGVLPADWQTKCQITRTKDLSHGDFASNIAMTAAKAAKIKLIEALRSVAITGAPLSFFTP